MATTVFSAVKYLGADAPGETRFTIPFPYLRSKDIFLFRQDESADPVVTVALSRPVDWDFDGGLTVVLNEALADNESVSIRRFTQQDKRLSEFHDGSALTEDDLNDVTRQLIYLIQEINDSGTISDGGIPGGSSGDGTQNEIEQNVLDALNASQLFQDLTALIPLVDINAENAIADILNNYDDWTLGQERMRLQNLMSEYLTGEPATVTGWTNIVQNEAGNLAQRVTLTESNTANNNAYIGTVETAFTAEKEATATRFTEVGAKIDTDVGVVAGQISDLDTVVVNEQQATAERFAVIGTNFDGNLATIGDLRQATSTQDSVVSLMVTEMITELDLDDALGRSVYLTGVETSVRQDLDGKITANTEAITTQISQVNDTIAGVQDLAETTATDQQANTSVLQTMASTFGGLDLNGDVDAQAFTAAITNQWETFASGEAETARASAVSEIEANTIPIYFNDVPPDHKVEPYLSGAFGTTGFKNGSTWFKTITGTSKSMRQFVFHRDLTDRALLLGNIPGITFADNGERIFFITNNTSGQGQGAWIEQTSNALGALLQESGSVDVSAEGVIAQLTSLTEGVFEGRVAAVETNQEVFLGPDGHMNTQWNVRMNQYASDGTPVVAGVGLGLETDPDNPENGSVSNFIVMADNFQIVKPPTDGFGNSDPLDGDNWEEGSAIVPFSVDSETGYVRINGDLFIDDTLFAYAGRLDSVHLGKAVFGEMYYGGNTVNSDWGNLVNPNGFRMELLSSTNNYWSSVDRNYLIWAGYGTRADNNAVFWLDSKGNAFFGGQVQAEGISGRMANAQFIDVWLGTPGAGAAYAPVADFTNPNWQEAGGIQYFDLDSERLLTPVVQVGVDCWHGNNGEARLLLSYLKDDGLWSAWDPVHNAMFTMYGVPGEQGMSQVYLTGIPRDGAGNPVNTRTQVRAKVQISGKHGEDWYCVGYKGMFMGLPVSRTPALGPGKTTSDTGDVGEPISIAMDDITFDDGGDGAVI